MRCNTGNAAPPSDFRRSTASVTMEATIHQAITKPSVAPNSRCPASKPVPSAPSTVASAAQRRRWKSEGSEASFQRASGPMAISTTMGTISGTNTASK